MNASLSRRRIVQATGAALATAALPALAQSGWPSRPIRIVVPYTAGGFTDQMARLLTVGLQKQLGQPVVIDNKPGANSIIGVEAVAKAAPDGHTFGVVIPAFTANTTLYPKLPYNPRKDLVGVSLMGVSPLVAAVAPNAPFKTVKELVAYAKANPGKLSYGSAGVGSSNHLGALLFSKRSGIDMNHVPYKGNAPAMTDVMGGQINMMMDIISTASVYINSGKVRAIAVTSPQRNASLPNVPTFAESGIEGLKGFDVGGWYAVYGPKGMSADLQAKLNKAVNAALAQPELKAKYKELGYDEWTGAPEKLAERAAKERQMWSTVTQGIVVD